MSRNATPLKENAQINSNKRCLDISATSPSTLSKHLQGNKKSRRFLYFTMDFDKSVFCASDILWRQSCFFSDLAVHLCEMGLEMEPPPQS